MGQPNLTQEAKLSGANGTRSGKKKKIPCLSDHDDHEQDSDLYPADAQVAERDYRTPHTSACGLFFLALMVYPSQFLFVWCEKVQL